MTTPIWDNDFIYQGAQGVKVSCHVGDYGSTAFCNMIGDQPLFYIDTIDEADEELFMFEETQAFPTDERFLSAMRAKLDAYEKTAETLSKVKLETAEHEFDKTFFSATPKINSMDSIVDYGSQSGLFKSYLTKMDAAHIKLCADVETATAAYDRDLKIIYFNPSLDNLMAAKSLIRAMRTAWHHHNGALLNPLLFQPEEAVLLNRLIEADNDIAIVAFLWDMKLAGDKQAWPNAMASMDYDICTAYAMEAMTDFRAIKSGLAMRAAFEKWFLSGRCKSHDRDIIQIMMGDNTDITISNEDSSRMIAMDIIAALGKQPLGQNYLAPIVTNIMNDPIFGEVRDRSNANFLWFVTFERRMESIENEMDNQTEPQHIDNIVEMTPSAQPPMKKGDNEMASIFFLDHFRAG